MSIVKIFIISLIIFATALPVSFAQDADPGASTDVAQAADPSPSPDASAPSPSILIDEAPAPAAQAPDSADPSVSPQNTDSGQSANASGSLQPTFNPNNTIVDDDSTAVIIIDDPTSTPPVIPLPPVDEPTSTPIDVPPVDPITTPTPIDEPTPTDPSVLPSPSPVPLATSTPSPTPIPIPTTANQVTNDPVDSFALQEPEIKFVFKIKSGVIAARKDRIRRIGDWEKKKNNQPSNPAEEVTAAPIVVPNDAKGVLDVSGTCSDKYFVVLIFRGPEDYDANPASYIFNKAFDCVNGQYQYSIKDLPENLADGTYYLLIGGEGDVGAWKPISALVPITINRNIN